MYSTHYAVVVVVASLLVSLSLLFW